MKHRGNQKDGRLMKLFSSDETVREARAKHADATLADADGIEELPNSSPVFHRRAGGSCAELWKLGMQKLSSTDRLKLPRIDVSGFGESVDYVTFRVACPFWRRLQPEGIIIIKTKAI